MTLSTYCSRRTVSLGVLLVALSLILISLPGGESQGQDSTPPPPADASGWRTYPDTDPLLVYGGGAWRTYDIPAATGGTLTTTTGHNATLTIYFEGTGIRVLYSKGPEGGTFDGRLDEFWVRYADGAAESYSYGHVLAFEDVEPGQHTLTVTNEESAIWIEAVQVQGVLLSLSLPHLVQITPTPYAVSAPSQPGGGEPSGLPRAVEPLESYVFHEIASEVDLVDTILNVVNVDIDEHHVLLLEPRTYPITTAQTAGPIGYTGLPILGQAIIVGMSGLDEEGNSLPPDQVTEWAVIQKTSPDPDFDIFHVAVDAKLTLYNVKVVDGGGTARFSGGGLVNDGELHIYNSQIISSESNYWGGGIHNNGTLVIINSEISDNSAVDITDHIGGGGSAIINYGASASLTVYCTTFQNNHVEPTIEGGDYVPFTVPGGAIHNESPTCTVSHSNFINNTADGENPYCSQYPPEYGYCPLHIRDLYSAVSIDDASDNYWSDMSILAAEGEEITTAPTAEAPISYGAHAAEGEDCFVPKPPSQQPECAITINEGAALHIFEPFPGEWPIELKVYLDRYAHRTDINIPDHGPDIEPIEDVEGYIVSYTNDDLVYLEADVFYLDRTFNIVHIRGTYAEEEGIGIYEDVDFWVFTGDSVSPHPDNPDPYPGDPDKSCFDDLLVRPDAQETIALLGEYGVEIAEDGQEWTNDELRAILTGVMRTAEAYSQAGVTGDTRQDIFRTVMISGEQYDHDHIIFLRMGENNPPDNPQWDRYYSDGVEHIDGPWDGGLAAGYCRNFGPMDDTHPRVIACRGTLINGDSEPPVKGELSQYTAVHEMGHLFDNRTGDELTRMVHDPDGKIIISDCDNESSTVMGYWNRPGEEGWRRGTRGWGSVGPVGAFSNFQQNPTDEELVEYTETAADMFLNWVYRRTSDDAPTSDLCENTPGNNVIGTWEGFRNIDEKENLDKEGRLPGNARYIWMDTQMRGLLGIE